MTLVGARRAEAASPVLAAGAARLDAGGWDAAVDGWAVVGAALPAGGDPVAGLVAVRTPEAVACFAGLVRAGWCVGMMDPAWGGDEVRGAVAQLAPAYLVAPADHPIAGRVAAAAGWARVAGAPGGWTVWRVRAGGGVPPSPPAPDARFYAGFTSGSAGRPKVFTRTHRSWTASFIGLDHVAPPPADGVMLVPGPLSSSHFLFGLCYALHAGVTAELASDEGGAGARAARLASGEVASAVVVPTMLADLVERMPPGALPRPVTFYCAGAALAPSLRRRVESHFPGSGIVEYYGASELSFVAIRTPGDGAPDGTVGRAFPGVEIAIRDERGRSLPAGEEGEVWVRSPLVFAGYRGAAAAGGARAADGGWWTVGDRGRLDADGYLAIAGRGTTLIITGGVNVQPEEVEDVLTACEGVAHCTVVGIPHGRWGEEVVAIVTPAPGASLSRASLRAPVARRLSPAKRPRRYLTADAPPPRLPGGKVDRAAVRGQVLAGDLAEVR